MFGLFADQFSVGFATFRLESRLLNFVLDFALLLIASHFFFFRSVCVCE